MTPRSLDSPVLRLIYIEIIVANSTSLIILMYVIHEYTHPCMITMGMYQLKYFERWFSWLKKIYKQIFKHLHQHCIIKGPVVTRKQETCWLANITFSYLMFSGIWNIIVHLIHTVYRRNVNNLYWWGLLWSQKIFFQRPLRYLAHFRICKLHYDILLNRWNVLSTKYRLQSYDSLSVFD